VKNKKYGVGCTSENCDASDFAGRLHALPSGHATAAPPSSAMKSRRFTRSPRRRAQALSPAGRDKMLRDESSQHHSITSSAMASSDGGTVRPSIRAVSALITRSNFDDCTTGRERPRDCGAADERDELAPPHHGLNPVCANLGHCSGVRVRRRGGGAA
jgi:hypothetical protein